MVSCGKLAAVPNSISSRGPSHSFQSNNRVSLNSSHRLAIKSSPAYCAIVGLACQSSLEPELMSKPQRPRVHRQMLAPRFSSHPRMFVWLWSNIWARIQRTPAPSTKVNLRQKSGEPAPCKISSTTGTIYPVCIKRCETVQKVCSLIFKGGSWMTSEKRDWRVACSDLKTSVLFFILELRSVTPNEQVSLKVSFTDIYCKIKSTR